MTAPGDLVDAMNRLHQMPQKPWEVCMNAEILIGQMVMVRAGERCDIWKPAVILDVFSELSDDNTWEFAFEVGYADRTKGRVAVHEAPYQIRRHPACRQELKAIALGHLRLEARPDPTTTSSPFPSETVYKERLRKQIGNRKRHRAVLEVTSEDEESPSFHDAGSSEDTDHDAGKPSSDPATVPHIPDPIAVPTASGATACARPVQGHN